MPGTRLPIDGATHHGDVFYSLENGPEQHSKQDLDNVASLRLAGARGGDEAGHGCDQRERITMPLFHVQDSDRPGWVIAENFAEAVRKWETAVAKENDGDKGEPPKGVSLIADDDEIIVGENWLAPYET
jgi:hypothetical protein